MEIKLRPYQNSCIDMVKQLKKDGKKGNYIINLATGLGKTVVFSQFEKIFEGNILILSHRQELVFQPKKYFESSYGIELAKVKSNGEKIVSASVQTLVKRLDKFDKNHFEVIITDECQHSVAKTYKEIYEYFNYDFHFGFSATIGRGDNIGLDNVFEEIIFERDLKWGMLNKFLCGIECKRITIGYDLNGVKQHKGDYQEKDLADHINIASCNKAIADVFYQQARGQTVIFCVNVAHCYEIQKLIPGSKVIDGKTKQKEREQTIIDFTNRKFQCLINCMIFTEGTDMPLIETIIIGRPTKNTSLYTQMVGRGLRLYPGKEKLLLIDCVGVTGQLDLCTAPTLFGLNTDLVARKDDQDKIEGDLFDLENKIIKLANKPSSWINNIKNVEIFKKKNGYDMHNVNYIMCANGDFLLQIDKFKCLIKKPDELGYTIDKFGNKRKLQDAFDLIYNHLVDNFQDKSLLWDTRKIKNWGNKKASSKQKNLIKKYLAGNLDIDIDKISKQEANIIISNMFAKQAK